VTGIPEREVAPQVAATELVQSVRGPGRVELAHEDVVRTSTPGSAKVDPSSRPRSTRPKSARGLVNDGD